MSIVVGPVTAPGEAGGVCAPWATAADLCAPCKGSTIDAALLERCLFAASEVLYWLSGRKYPGLCVDTVRPSARYVFDGGSGVHGGVGVPGTGYRPGPGWGACMCNRTIRTGCNSVPEVSLPGQPVARIVQLKVDGAELVDGVDFRVDDGRWLVRLPDPATGAERGWPCCQLMTLADTAAGTWSVQYEYGAAPPTAGVLAAAELGCQLALALSPAGTGECRLPRRVMSIVRQGVSAVVLDPFTFLDKGRTGLYDVDLFLGAENPKGISRRATAWRPGTSRSVRRTG
jgi:hypothetical protein